jgi:hypothetical protein
MNAPGLDLLVGSPLRGAPNLTKLLLFTGPSGEVVRTLAVSLQNDRERWSATRCAYSIAAPPPSLFPSVPVTPNAHSLSSARRAFLEEIASLTTAIP